MHSGVILFLWLIGVVFFQSLPTDALLLSLCLLIFFTFCLAPARFWRLLKRVGVLIVAIVILFAWFSPGEAVLADWPRISPTREGIAMAVVHVGRLLVVICAVAVLLEKLSLQRLTNGLNALARPFTFLGLERQRLAIRLLLVLQYMDGRGSFSRRHWRDWLVVDDFSTAGPVSLQVEKMGWLDWGVLVVVSMVMTGYWLWSGSH